MRLTETGKVVIEGELEPALYEELKRAAIAIDIRGPGIVREAVIFFLSKMGFNELSDAGERFKYVEAQRRINMARQCHSSGLSLTEVEAARGWNAACEEAYNLKDPVLASAVLARENNRNPLGNATYTELWNKVSNELGYVKADGTMVSAWDVSQEVKRRLTQST